MTAHIFAGLKIAGGHRPPLQGTGEIGDREQLLRRSICYVAVIALCPQFPRNRPPLQGEFPLYLQCRGPTAISSSKSKTLPEGWSSPRALESKYGVSPKPRDVSALVAPLRFASLQPV